MTGRVEAVGVSLSTRQLAMNPEPIPADDPRLELLRWQIEHLRPDYARRVVDAARTAGLADLAGMSATPAGADDLDGWGALIGAAAHEQALASFSRNQRGAA